MRATPPCSVQILSVLLRATRLARDIGDITERPLTLQASAARLPTHLTDSRTLTVCTFSRPSAADLIPLQNDPTDLRIMQLIESLRQDDERESAVASLVSEYRAKVDELNKAKERGGGGGGGGGGGTKGKERAAAGPSVAAHQRHVRTLHRLSLQCPHNGTRTELKKLMELVASCDAFTVSPIPRAVASAYLDNDNIPSLVDGGAAAGEEFVEAFRADGRVSHMTQVMACHPEYLTRFREVHNWLLWDEGPLPLPDRHLIAVMAAGRHNCRYLAEIHTKHFLDLGGDPDWLMGAAHLPPKLRSLVHLNAVLAHQPWRLVVDDIAQLVKSGVDSWSLNELVQALSIMIHFHALQSFVLGCGIAMEVDLNPVCDGLSDDGAAAAVDGGEPAVPLSVFVEVRDKLRADGDVTGPDDTEEANLKAFADAETEEAKSPQQQQAVLPSAQWFPLFECSLLSNSPDRSIPGHEDFNIRSKEYTVFRTTVRRFPSARFSAAPHSRRVAWWLQSFSWEDQCYSTLSRWVAPPSRASAFSFRAALALIRRW